MKSGQIPYAKAGSVGVGGTDAVLPCYTVDPPIPLLTSCSDTCSLVFIAPDRQKYSLFALARRGLILHGSHRGH